MKLNQLIAQALNKPVETLTSEDVNEALLTEIWVWGDGDDCPANVAEQHQTGIIFY